MYKQQQEGLYGKFIISKADKTPIDPKAKYIVLRYDAANVKDGSAARNAIREYADQIKEDNPEFALDLLIAISKEYADIAEAKLLNNNN